MHALCFDLNEWRFRFKQQGSTDEASIERHALYSNVVGNFMTGQIFKSIRDPQGEDDWFIVETDRGFYELRLGGINKVENCKSTQTVNLPFRDVRIKQVLSDDFAVIIELDNGQCIVHSDTYLYGDGLTAFEIRTVEKNVIESDGGLEGMIPISG